MMKLSPFEDDYENNEDEDDDELDTSFLDNK